MQEIKFTSPKQYLFGHAFSINAKKIHTEQSTLQVFFLCPNRNEIFSSVFYVLGANWFGECFFILCDNWKAVFFIKVCRDVEIFQPLFLKQVFWKKSVVYVFSTITVQCWYQNSKIKLTYTIFILDKRS